MENKKASSKNGTVLLLIASIGFLIASLWMMQTQIKPRNIGNVEFAIIDLGNEAQNQLYYIDKAAEYSLNKSLEIKSRHYTGEYTNKQVCNLQLNACKEDEECKTNLKLFCEDELAKGFKEEFSKYLKTFNEQTGNKLDVNDYSIEIKIITSEMTTKIREVEVVGKTEKNLEAKKEGVEHRIKPNFRTKTSLA